MGAPRVEHCRTCRAPIFWIKTAKGKQAPVNAGPFWLCPDPQGAYTAYKQINGELVRGYRFEADLPPPQTERDHELAAVNNLFWVAEAHFATCPYADQHRRK